MPKKELPKKETLSDRTLGAYEQAVLRHLMHLTAEMVELKSALSVILALERNRMVEGGMSPADVRAIVQGMFDEAAEEHNVQLRKDLDRLRERFESEILFKDLWEESDDSAPS